MQSNTITFWNIFPQPKSSPKQFHICRQILKYATFYKSQSLSPVLGHFVVFLGEKNTYSTVILPLFTQEYNMHVCMLNLNEHYVHLNVIVRKTYYGIVPIKGSLIVIWTQKLKSIEYWVKCFEFESLTGHEKMPSTCPEQVVFFCWARNRSFSLEWWAMA